MSKITAVCSAGKALLVSTVLLISCSQNPDNESINETLDSITVTPEITLEIMDSDEDPFGQLGGLTVDPSGQIVVSDFRTNVIRFFDSDGGHIQTFGREGSGPGEFQAISQMGLFEDGKLWVFDSRLQRITSFIPGVTGQFQLSSQFALPGSTYGFPFQVYKVEDGFLVGYNSTFSDVSARRSTITLARLNEEGTVLQDSVISFTEREMLILPDQPMVAHAIPFSWVTHIDIGVDQAIFLGKSDSLRVEKYNANGERTGVIKQPINRQQVHESDLGSMEPDHPVADYVPDYHPAFVDFHVDNDGYFWFNIGTVAQEEHRWVVLDSSGSPTLSFILPQRLRVFEIISGSVYGIFRDENGQQSIRVYNIEDI